MCERLPGDRCSHHVKQEVDKKTLKAASIFVASGAASPQELTGKDREAYDSAVAELRAAQEELNHTPTEIKKRKTQAAKAREAGNIAYAEELEASVEASEALRARRKAGLKLLGDTEKQVGRSMNTKSYQQQEKEQAQAEVDSKITHATDGLNKKQSQETTTSFAQTQQAAGRREIARLKKARTQLDKDLSQAVDSGNAAQTEAVLAKIKQNIQKISYVSTRNEQYQEKVRQASPPPTQYAHAGCGGGCGAYSVPAPATPTRPATGRKTTRSKPSTPAPATYVPTYHRGGCGGGGC